MKKILIFGLQIILVISLSGCVTTSYEEQIDFQLNGLTIVEITTEETYVEEGFVATKGDLDLSSYVTITGVVTEGIAGTYYFEYTLSYEGTEISLLRAINIVEAYLADDPDRILYDGVCDEIEIHFIDLDAMGDSTLIDCGDFEIVIDAGTSGVGRDLVAPYLHEFVTDGIIELVIATHPDSDHFGGFTGNGVFHEFIVERILDFGYEKDTLIYDAYESSRDSEGALVCSGSEALAGINGCQSYFTITDNLVLTVIDTGNYDGLDSNHNENSIVVLLQHGDVSFLFTGDAEFEAEEHMAEFIK